MAQINITDLKLRAIIGTNDWERENKQDVIINIAIDYDAEKAAQSDQLDDTLDYKAMTKKIIKEVEGSQYFLIEKLADRISSIALENPKTEKVSVRVDKPFALRFADSVSVTLTKER